MAFDLGDTVPLGIYVRDSTGTLTNASTNVLTIEQPDGTTTTPSTSNPSTGAYTCLFTPTQSGRHVWKWPTTTPATGETGTFDVAEAMPPLIVSLPDAKAFLNILSTDTTFDDELKAMLEGITAIVEGGDGKDFPGVGPVVRRTVTSQIFPYGACEYVLPYTQIVSLTSAIETDSGASTTITDWVVTDGWVLRRKYWAALPVVPITLTYVIGRPSLPASIRQGALEILREAWTTQRGGESKPFIVSYRALAWLGNEVESLGFA